MTKTLKVTWAKRLAAATVVAASMAAPAAAFVDGCPSGQIMAGFSEFGKTGKMDPVMGKWLGDVGAQRIEPFKPFDNVDYIGVCWVSAWLVHTDDGIVLVDTLYGPFLDKMVMDIEASGTDLADIKYVLMTHGHRDHVGGASVLKAKLPNARFVMSERGWTEFLEGAEASKGGRRAFDSIGKDIVLNDGEAIELGGNTFTLIETPGHTWGTSSYIYDVKDGDKTHRAITIGGLGLNAIEGPSQVEAYIRSVDRIASLVDAAGENVEVHLTTHGFSNNLEETRAVLEARKDGDPNPFVAPDAILSQVAGLRAGAVERLAIETAK